MDDTEKTCDTAVENQSRAMIVGALVMAMGLMVALAKRRRKRNAE